MINVTIDNIVDTAMQYLGEYGVRARIRKQCTQLRKQGWKNEDIKAAIIYWFDEKDGDPSKSGGGISILEYIRGDYFSQKRRKEEYKNKNKNVVYEVKPKEVNVKRKPITKPYGWNEIN